MRILEYAWNALTAVSGAECDRVTLILDESMPQPTIGLEDGTYAIRLPMPKREREGLYSLQGLYADAEGQNWTTLWRLFRASIYHAAFHVLNSDVGAYSEWARGKDRYVAIYAISLVEDYKVTAVSLGNWRPLLQDIAYANYVAASRLILPTRARDSALRTALCLLTELWGVPLLGDWGDEEEARAIRAANRIRSKVQNYVFGEAGKESLAQAADIAYRLVEKQGILSIIPSFPHTEAHSGCPLFENKLTETEQESGAKLDRAYEALGIDSERDPIAPHTPEASEALQAIGDGMDKLARVASHYSGVISGSRLKGVFFPPADISSFLRTRLEFAGSIRSVRDQLMQVKNVLDESQGQESGQVDMTTAMQVIASKQVRTDVFVRDELMMKDEAWAILVDASKSISHVAMQLKGITTCLAEVAKDLMREKSKWGVFAFNDSLQIVKDFDEPYTIDTKARIGGLSQGGPTYLPDALSAASKALSSRPIESKYLVVVSDCLPTGYEGIEAELEARIKAISRSGIMLLGIGVQSRAVQRYFAVNCVMSSPHEMMKFFVKAYLELSSTG